LASEEVMVQLLRGVVNSSTSTPPSSGGYD